MTSSAGFQLTAGRIPGERIATTTSTSDVGTFTTTETQLDAVTAALVSGRVYKVVWEGAGVSDAIDTTMLVRIRENNTSGTIIQERNFYIPTGSSSGYAMHLSVPYTAVSTANKTFVITGTRNGGSGNLLAEGAANHPRQLFVDYISG